MAGDSNEQDRKVLTTPLLDRTAVFTSIPSWKFMNKMKAFFYKKDLGHFWLGYIRMLGQLDPQLTLLYSTRETVF